MYEYFYGAMLPSTGMVAVFRLQQRSPGLVILLPDRQNSGLPAPYINLPKHMATFAQSNYWCKVLNCTTAADLNDMIASRSMRDFVRVNEALHDKSLAEIAQDIINRSARAVFIAGPSSSGKTTFANRLSIHLRVNGYRPFILSMDDFYLDRDKVPLEADGKPDLEALSALDLPYFNECLGKLLAGQVAMMPTFSFKTGRRKEELTPVQLDHLQPVIVEGIHGLNPALHEGIDSRATTSSATPSRWTPWPCGTACAAARSAGSSPSRSRRTLCSTPRCTTSCPSSRPSALRCSRMCPRRIPTT